MNPENELDTLVAREIMGQAIGTVKPYTTDISAAWEVAEKVGISLIPIEGGSWFALVGQEKGWSSPSDFITYLQSTDFANAGAAVAESASLAICIAAIKAIQNREIRASETSGA